MNGKQAIKILEKLGFRIIRINGSHHMLSDGTHRVTVPVHGTQELKPGTLKSIEKQSGVTLK